MYKIPAKTLFAGHSLIFVPECHSTNSEALQLCRQHELQEGTVVITDHQTAGRGQSGRNWSSAPGSNLTFSLVLRPRTLPASRQFALSMALALGIRNYVIEVTQKDVFVKWPNDILVEGKKVCGILIENVLQGSAMQYCICGVGLNVNQMDWPFEGPVSLARVAGKAFVLAEALERLLEHIEAAYLRLRESAPDVHHAYVQALYRRGHPHRYRVGEREFLGSIRDVDEHGRLVMDTEEGPALFAEREITYLA